MPVRSSAAGCNSGTVVLARDGWQEGKSRSARLRWRRFWRLPQCGRRLTCVRPSPRGRPSFVGPTQVSRSNDTGAPTCATGPAHSHLLLLFLALGSLLALPTPALAMHIAEGILPASWCGLWFLAIAPFVAWGLWQLRRRSAETPAFKPLLGLVGAGVFIISCLPIPVPTAGTCSHPVGTGLAAILVGPALTVVITSIALLLQALFLAHGGLTTLGANVMSMGVVGAFVGYGAFRAARALGASWAVSAFAAGLLSDWATYAMTSLMLALALHGRGGVRPAFLTILLAFVPTQVPLGLLEGFLSAGAVRFILTRRPELLRPAVAGEAR